MSELLVPFEHNDMVKAMWVCALVGGIILAMAMLGGPRAIAYLLSDASSEC